MAMGQNYRLAQAGGWCAAALLMCAAGTEGAPTFRTVALTGLPAPDAGVGVAFGDFFTPNQAAPAQLNRYGHAVFAATVTGSGVTAANDSGLWSEGSGTLRMVAREGDHAPQTPTDVVYGSFASSLAPFGLDSNGVMLFKGQLSGPSVTTDNDRALWLDAPGSVTLVVREGDVAPDTPPGTSIRVINDMSMDLSGRIATQFTLTGPGVTDANDAGIWIGPPGGLELVLRESDPAPGFDPDVTVASFYSVEINEIGDMMTKGSVAGPGFVQGYSDSAMWSDRSGVISKITRSGAHAPGTPIGTGFLLLNSPLWNNLSCTAFTSSLFGPDVTTENRSGVWCERNPTLTMVMRAGDPAPDTDPGVVFDSIQALSLNDVSEVAFRAKITGPGVVSHQSDEGIWSEGRGPVQLIARALDQAPDTPAGVVFYPPFFEVALNRVGQTAFRCGLTGPGWNNRRGIWMTDATGAARLIVYTGMLFDVDDDPTDTDFREINALEWQPTINDNGQFVFRARFTDGSSGVFVATLSAPPPCPGDVSGDERTNSSDFNILAGHFGQAVSPFTNGDLTGDGLVDAADFNVLASDFGCGP